MKKAKSVKTKKERIIKKTDSWLPIFPGFYNTIFEPNTDNDEYMAKRDGCPEEVLDWYLGTDEYHKSIDDYEKELVSDCVDVISNWLLKSNVASKVIFQSLYSPREYNFYTDAIYVQYQFTKSNIKNINSYIAGHFDEWAQYLTENYTSREGFISRYSNDANDSDWAIESALDNKHTCGAILDFILSNEYGNQTESIEFELFYSLNTDSVYFPEAEQLVEMYNKEHPNEKVKLTIDNE